MDVMNFCRGDLFPIGEMKEEEWIEILEIEIQELGGRELTLR
jgi:hypothetical protein